MPILNKQPNKEEFTHDYEVIGFSYKELGDKYKFSKQTAANYVKKWGLVKAEKKDPDWLEDFISDYEVHGLYSTELSLKYGFTINQVNFRILKYKLKHARNMVEEGFRWCNYGRHAVAISEYGGESYCNSCHREYRNELAESKIDRALDELGMQYKCSSCGYNKSRAAIDFHHHGDDKDKSIGQLRNSAYERILEEMKKCVPLCRNCHRIEHNYDLTTKKYLFSLFDGPAECSACGTTDPAILEFDHLSHTVKGSHAPNAMVTRAFTEDEIRVELSKCRILCGNCHREKTYGIKAT